MTPRILVVDDEPRMGAVVAAALERAGYACETSTSAEAALATLEMRDVDLVVTDWKMAGMDGLALLRQLHARRPGLPVETVLTHSPKVKLDRLLDSSERGVDGLARRDAPGKVGHGSAPVTAAAFVDAHEILNLLHLNSFTPACLCTDASVPFGMSSPGCSCGAP